MQKHLTHISIDNPIPGVEYSLRAFGIEIARLSGEKRFDAAARFREIVNRERQIAMIDSAVEAAVDRKDIELALELIRQKPQSPVGDVLLIVTHSLLLDAPLPPGLNTKLPLSVVPKAELAFGWSTTPIHAPSKL